MAVERVISLPTNVAANLYFLIDYWLIQLFNVFSLVLIGEFTSQVEASGKESGYELVVK